jgi:hypothetical protein
MYKTSVILEINVQLKRVRWALIGKEEKTRPVIMVTLCNKFKTGIKKKKPRLVYDSISRRLVHEGNTLTRELTCILFLDYNTYRVA